MVLLISYDLNGGEESSSYKDVREMIEENADSSIKPLLSQWLVDTSESVQVWQEWMLEVADADDSWLISKLERPYNGWLNKGVWDWLNERL